MWCHDAMSWQSKSLSFLKHEENNLAPFSWSQRMQLILRLPWYVDQTFCHSVLQYYCLGQLCQSFHSNRNDASFLRTQQGIMKLKRWLHPFVGEWMCSWVLLYKTQSYLKIRRLLSPPHPLKAIKIQTLQRKSNYNCISLIYGFLIFRKNKAEKIIMDSSDLWKRLINVEELLPA